MGMKALPRAYGNAKAEIAPLEVAGRTSNLESPCANRLEPVVRERPEKGASAALGLKSTDHMSRAFEFS